MALLALAAAVFSSRAGFASAVFPQHLKTHWQVRAALPGDSNSGCPLCHTTDPGRSGSATQRFALRLRNLGLVPGDLSSLDSALDQAKASDADSDGDGFSDFDEVAGDGTNPNDPAAHRAAMTPNTGGSAGISGDAGGVSGEGGALDSCTVETLYPKLGHGCGLARASSADSLWLALIVAAAAGRIRRSSARRR